MPLFNSNQLTAIQDATKSAISSKSKQRNFTVNKKPIRLIELFSGIGAQSSGMDRLGANYERYKTSEWDINAVASYRETQKICQVKKFLIYLWINSAYHQTENPH